MSLTPGARLGSYEVVAAIGEGGMGEVYRARDTKLNRDVALKVLPDLVAGDLDRLARFRREAQVLASLNHPNIAHLYGFEDPSTSSGQAPACLVMELVEGPTLADRIAAGPLPLADALPIARQIAEALEAAHEQGIVHRDLKPANVKVRDDGTVKVLDFGLAKALGPEGASATADAMNSPTLTVRGTQMGMILGTAAYMAPEQAKGKAVDKRADIWAFGVVLHEMLTGGHLFLADTIPETLAHVMTRPIDLSTLPDATPRRVRDLVARCLEKDPKKRLRDIGEARIRLEDAISGAPEGMKDEPAGAAAVISAPPRPRGWIAAFAVALVAAVGLSIPALRYLTETPPPETRVDIVTPATTQPSSFALSPDGRQIVFVASADKVSRLWLRSLSTTAAEPLAGTEGAFYPFWSPDGRSVGFFAGGSLKRLSLVGGTPQTLAPVTNGSGGTWNADNVIVFAPSTTSPLMRVSASGGTVTAVMPLAPEQFGHFSPHFLPDGRRLLFRVNASEDTGGIFLGALDGGASGRLTPDQTSAVYAPGGWLLWMRLGSLMAQRLDVERRALTGEPVTLAVGVAADGPGLRGAVSVATTGLVAYRTAGSSLRQLTWVDRSGTTRGVVGEPDDLLSPRVSPDGRRVAMTRTAQGNMDLWLQDGARASRFTFDSNRDAQPVWSPEGARIAYQAYQRHGAAIGSKLTSGAGVAEPLLTTDQILTPTSWSADGRFLMYMAIDSRTNADIWVLPLTPREPQGHPEPRRGTSGASEDRKPFVFLQTPFREAYGSFSPDGRWVAYHSNESGRPEVYVRRFVPPSREASTFASATADKSADKSAGATGTAAGGPSQVSAAGGIHPVWRSDGKALYYLNPDGAMMAASITVTGDLLEPGAPVMLFPTRIYGGGADIQLGRQYDVTADGRFLINTVLNEAAAPITLLQNWNPAAER